MFGGDLNLKRFKLDLCSKVYCIKLLHRTVFCDSLTEAPARSPEYVINRGFGPATQTFNLFIQSFFAAYPFPSLEVAGGAGAYLGIIGRRRGTPWTSRQFITGLTYRDKQPSTLTFTPMANLE